MTWIEQISVWFARALRPGLRPVGLLPLVAASLVVWSAATLAQTPFGGVSPEESGQPLLLQADEMIYDNQNNTVIARGNVEIYKGTYTLLADQVIYDRAANTLTAEGNVRIKEPDGALITAERITLTDDFRDGFVRSLKIVTSDDARIAAARAIREDGETTVFERAIYTPCKLCKDNPEKPPTWRIKATRVIHRKAEAEIAYENAKFEFMGIPIAWIPFFKHADPSVKRKSGFLIPRVGVDSQLGYFTEASYYMALAPNYDFTFTPTFTEKAGILLKGRWRHRLRNGTYHINMAGVYKKLDFLSVSPGDDFRGSIDTAGEFDINEFWSWGWDVTYDTDDTFRRFYKIDTITQTDRVSQANLTGIGDRNYFDARLYHFGGLTFEDTPNSESRVLPVVDYNYIFADPILGGEMSFNSNLVSLTRTGGADSHKIVTELNWRRQLIDRRGQVITPFMAARGDLYQVSNVVDPITGVERGRDQVARGMLTGGVEYRYPLVKHGTRGSHIIEPIAQLIARPGLKKQEDISNEDARSLVFDDTLLFDIDKFSGYDRIETGTRANVGFRYTLQRYEGGYLRAEFGQSYHVVGDNEFRGESGLENTRSDYVAGLYVQPLKYFRFVGQARFDEKSFALRRTDLTSTLSYGPISTTANYSNLKAQPGIGILADRQETAGSLGVKLTEHWLATAGIRYDIERKKRINDYFGLQWSDDCFALSVTYSESFIRDRDIEPSETVMVRFQFKHLGAYNVDASGLDDKFFPGL